MPHIHHILRWLYFVAWDLPHHLRPPPSTAKHNGMRVDWTNDVQHRLMKRFNVRVPISIGAWLIESLIEDIIVVFEARRHLSPKVARIIVNDRRTACVMEVNDR